MRIAPIRSAEGSVLFDLNPATLPERYPLPEPWEKASKHVQAASGVMPARRFGTFEMTVDGGRRLILESLYPLGPDGDGPLGLRPIPVTDEAEVQVPVSGSDEKIPIRGSEALETHVRQSLGLAPTDPFVSLHVFNHPEIWRGQLFDLADPSIDNLLKFELGQTHAGFYVGHGRTINSPPNYHDSKWDNKGYPASVFALTYEPVANSALMRNLFVISHLLGKTGQGPTAPINYKQDVLRAVNLSETLDYFRAWLDQSWVRPQERQLYGARAKPLFWYLKNDESFAVNCSEFVSIVVNLAVNVPQNLESYEEIWGRKAGRKLWRLAEEKWQNEVAMLPGAATKPAVTYAEFGASSHPALWKKLGIRHPGSIRQIGKSLLWQPLTTADMLGLFLEHYVSWVELGSPQTLTFMIGLAPMIVDRMKVNYHEYFAALKPIITRMVIRERATVMHASTKFRVQTDAGTRSLPALAESEGAEKAAAAYVAFMRAALLDNPVIGGIQGIVTGSHASQVEAYQAAKNTYDQAKTLYERAHAAYLEELRRYEAGELGEGAEPPAEPAPPVAPLPVTSRPYDIVAELLKPAFDAVAGDAAAALSTPPVTPEAGWRAFRQDVATAFEVARSQEILTAIPGIDYSTMTTRDGQRIVAVKFYAPPQLFQRIVTGGYPMAEPARFVPLGTVFDAAELQLMRNVEDIPYRIE